MHHFNIQIKILVFWVTGEHTYTSVSLCLFLPINPLWVCCFTVLLERDDYSGGGCIYGRTRWGPPPGQWARLYFLLEQIEFVSKKGFSHYSSGAGICYTMDYSLNVLSIHLFAVRTKWLNITRNWRGWPEDKPLCSKLKTPPVFLWQNWFDQITYALLFLM